MKNPVKLVVTSKKALQFKYGKHYAAIPKALGQLRDADKLKELDTKIVYIDDAASARAAGIKAAGSTDMKSCKASIDALYAKHNPAYIVILGAQDIIPFQEISNPAEDEDNIVPSDLPYACDAPYGKTIDSFTGPTRVVGRIPDIPGQQSNTHYLETLIRNAINHKSKDADQYRGYFAVTAQVCKKSTEKNLHSMFGNRNNLHI